MLAAILALGLAAPAAPAAPPAASSAGPPEGTVAVTLPELRALIGQPQQAAAGEIATPGYALACTPPAKAGQVEVSCRFARTIGDTTIHPSFELAGRIAIRELRLDLQGGRVAGLSFRASGDDYDAVQALLTKAYGAAKLSRGVIRTELGPRDQVRLVWGAASRAARIVDPAPPDFGLQVELGG